MEWRSSKQFPKDFWLPGRRWQSPDFPEHFVLLRGFHVQSTAPTLHPRASSCTSQIPSSGGAQGTLKALTALRLQQFPGSKPAMDTGAASSHTCSSQTHPACSDPALQSFSGASRYQYQLPTPWHSPGTAGSPQARQEHSDPTHSPSPWLPTTHRAPTNQSTAPSSALP